MNTNKRIPFLMFVCILRPTTHSRLPSILTLTVHLFIILREKSNEEVKLMNKYVCIPTYFLEKSKINSLLKVHCDNKHRSRKILFRKSPTYTLIVTFDPREKSRASNLNIITCVGSLQNPFFAKLIKKPANLLQ